MYPENRLWHATRRRAERSIRNQFGTKIMKCARRQESSSTSFWSEGTTPVDIEQIADVRAGLDIVPMRGIFRAYEIEPARASVRGRAFRRRQRFRALSRRLATKRPGEL